MFLWYAYAIFVSSILLYFIYARVYRTWRNLSVARVGVIAHNLKMKDFFMGRRNIALIYDEIYKRFPNEPYVGLYEITKPVLLVRDVELVNRILIKDFDYFQNRGMPMVNESVDPLETHLLNLRGRRWRSTRRRMTSLFLPGKLKRAFRLLEECVNDLEDHLLTYAKNGQPADLKDVAMKYATDVMSRLCFGFGLNALKTCEVDYRRLHQDASLFSARRLAIAILVRIHPKLAKLVPFTTTCADVLDIYRKLLRDAAVYNRSDTKANGNFWKWLTDLQDQDKRNSTSTDDVLTDTLISANLLLLFVAGIETSAIALSCCLYELALNPGIQDKVREEIKKVARTNELNYEVVCNELTYLDMVLSETLRKYPPVPVTPRISNRDYPIPATSKTIPKDTKIIIPIYSLHNDPKYYDTPEKFIPERFAHFDKISKPYLPFGDGPRNCLGKKLARDEIKYCLARILLKYSFAPNDRTEIPLQLKENGILFSVKHGVILSVRRVTTSDPDF